MTTLIDNELFEYLSHLESEVGKRVSTTPEGSLQNLAHSQMREIILAEREFLKYINSNGTQPVLSISPNGLPSVASLNPDLEKICELAEHETSFGDVAQRFKKGMKGKNRSEEGRLYTSVSEKEWSKELENRGEEKLQTQIGFAVSETEDGKFEISIREDIHLQGYDLYSKEFPVLIREGKMRYHVVWNRIIDDPEQIFYIPNTSSILQGRTITPSKKVFDDFQRTYEFRKKDYKHSGERMPWMFWRSWTPKNYAQFLNSGNGARVAITNSILEILRESLGKQINLRGVGKNDLEVTLAFSSIPFANAPQTTPKEEDLYQVDKEGDIVSSRFPTTFDLVFSKGAEKVGTVEYFLPRSTIHFCHGSYGGRYREGYEFALGKLKLHILGSAISNESQFEKLQDGLKKVGKRRL